MADVSIDVPSAGAGANAPVPGAAPTVTVQRVGDQVHITGDVSVLDRPTAWRLSELLQEAVRA